MDYKNLSLHPITEKSAFLISQWEYGAPYQNYNFKGRPNGYLMNKTTWGTEQFCLFEHNELIGYVSCQFDESGLWVGWSLRPDLCGKGNGHLFVLECIQKIRQVKNFFAPCPLYLRVEASNKRAIKAYQKACFIYSETIKDEVAYSGNIEDFWVMKNTNP